MACKHRSIFYPIMAHPLSCCLPLRTYLSIAIALCSHHALTLVLYKRTELYARQGSARPLLKAAVAMTPCGHCLGHKSCLKSHFWQLPAPESTVVELSLLVHNHILSSTSSQAKSKRSPDQSVEFPMLLRLWRQVETI